MPNIIYIVQHYSYTVQYCPLCVITIIMIIIIMRQCYSLCIPLPKSFTSVMYLIYSKLTVALILSTFCLLRWCSTSIWVNVYIHNSSPVCSLQDHLQWLMFFPHSYCTASRGLLSLQWILDALHALLNIPKQVDNWTTKQDSI